MHFFTLHIVTSEKQVSNNLSLWLKIDVSSIKQNIFIVLYQINRKVVITIQIWFDYACFLHVIIVRNRIYFAQTKNVHIYIGRREVMDEKNYVYTEPTIIE